MGEQMTIFDWLPSLTQPYPDINDISEVEAVQIVSDAIGLRFAYNERLRQWQAKKGKLKLSMYYSHFLLDDNHDLFLAADWQCGTSGGGSPCSGITQAIKWFRERINNEM